MNFDYVIMNDKQETIQRFDELNDIFEKYQNDEDIDKLQRLFIHVIYEDGTPEKNHLFNEIDVYHLLNQKAL